MPRITRKTQKVFASGAANNGVIGSAADGTKVLSTDLVTLQAKAAYLTGLNAITISGQRLPPLEEIQALHYIETSQIAYVLQEGIPEYDTGTTYYQKSIVKAPGTTQLYSSLTDNNTGNALPTFGTNNTNWQSLTDFGTGAQSLTTNGYKIFPGGLIVQWGYANTLSTNPVTVTFPIAFPNGVLSMAHVNRLADVVTYFGASTLTNFTATIRQVDAASPFGANFNWIAIGY
ncbi:gp53-like domain-containing protein [Dyadobacter psychrotolerans]|uniref:Putative tail fiber protein gp53-like C-terminal domain-containing protein n=1 Tax=Dyadobacter psychrotolerans TaxID=2541721 RepID=A0A4R5DT79_9BACT|nr:hypothetical protein [Dyadobacter psychrotolerans]TDE17726.1 hypothetical protein E0F88_07495 [Dyadobacter psychrotolerans]